MKTQTMNATAIDSKLQEFFVDQMEDIYWAEKKLVKTLPKLEDAATSEQLKNAFSSHLEQSHSDLKTKIVPTITDRHDLDF